MELHFEHLNAMNSSFQHNEMLMWEVLKYEITKLHTENPQNIRELHIECSCTEGYVYEEEIVVGENIVNVFACGNCGCWIMNVVC